MRGKRSVISENKWWVFIVQPFILMLNDGNES